MPNDLAAAIVQAGKNGNVQSGKEIRKQRRIRHHCITSHAGASG
jgi:hypothetical protein